MSKINKAEEPVVEENNESTMTDIERKISELYQTTIKDSGLREIVTGQIDNKTHKWSKRIAEEDGLFKGDKEEVDVKPLIRKWRGTFMKDEIKNFATNRLYVSDTSMGKKDLQRNLKLLNDNLEVMGTTNGFEQVERQLGLDDKLLQKSSTMSALRPLKDLEPFSGKKETYFDKKKNFDQEWENRLNEANNLMSKLNEEKKQRKEKIKEIRK